MSDRVERLERALELAKKSAAVMEDFRHVVRTKLVNGEWLPGREAVFGVEIGDKVLVVDGHTEPSLGIVGDIDVNDYFENPEADDDDDMISRLEMQIDTETYDGEAYSFAISESSDMYFVKLLEPHQNK